MKRCTCGRGIEMTAKPEPRPVRGNEGWLCVWCGELVCPRCYHVHGPAKHPDKYTVKETPNV